MSRLARRLEADSELPGAQWQRCAVHFERNVLPPVLSSSMTEVAQDMKAILSLDRCSPSNGTLPWRESMVSKSPSPSV
ncbi:MAG: transposase [Rubrobacteraceae bacterium]|nr:transposase [Rubrobacteraceae bacterium]